MDSPTLTTQLQTLGLLPEDEPARREVLALPARLPDARLLARELIKRDVLTPYQANQLLVGKGAGLLIGGYLLLERLGEGGMGMVFKARQPRLHRLVALKVIRRDLVTSPVAVERFLREIRAAAQLSHPNIVRAYDAGRAGDTYFFAMQLIDGVNLAQLVQEEGPLAVDRACDYTLQAAVGLQHIHEHGLAHRDIKPSNLMVTRQTAGSGSGPPSSAAGQVGPWGQVKILDLGTARLCEDEESGAAKLALTKLGTIMGTADYMAPEQALSSRHADIRSDIYSLGCSLYRMLTGQPPFPSGGPVEKIMRHQLEAPAPVEAQRPDVPAAVLAVLARMMAKKPAERFQTPQEVAEALLAANPSLPPVAAVPVVRVALPTPATAPVAAVAPVVVSVTAVAAPAPDFAFDDLTGAAPSPAVARLRYRQSSWTTSAWIAGAVAGGMLLLGLLLRLVLR
jgi:serine/threonine-protein kinase